MILKIEGVLLIYVAFLKICNTTEFGIGSPMKNRGYRGTARQREYKIQTWGVALNLSPLTVVRILGFKSSGFGALQRIALIRYFTMSKEKLSSDGELFFAIRIDLINWPATYFSVYSPDHQHWR